MSTLNPTATVNSPQQHELLRETINGQSFRAYPPATAKYEDIAQSADLFWEKLKAFHHSLGTKFMVPTVGGKALDLHHLFVEVTSRGGIEQVITDRKWKEVITAFNFPTTITSASFVLRKHYLSLLYHFEQVYHFNKHIPSVSGTDAMNGSLVNGPATLEEGSQQLQIGGSVSGIIDGKFDNGYLVTVNLGTNQLKGVLYHIPHTFHESQDSRSSDLPPRRRRKRSRLALCDPSQPKSNRSGYNFFFTEHYTQLKPLHNGQEKVIGKKVCNKVFPSGKSCGGHIRACYRKKEKDREDSDDWMVHDCSSSESEFEFHVDVAGSSTKGSVEPVDLEEYLPQEIARRRDVETISSNLLLQIKPERKVCPSTCLE